LALAALEGRRAVIACLSFGERGESASQWREGKSLDEVKAVRREEGEAAAAALGAEVRFFDAGDYPLVESPALLQSLIDLYRELQPDVVLTHSPSDPYNTDHGVAGDIARKARILAQAAGVPGADGALPKPSEVLGAPPVFCFEPHQSEVSGFRPDVLLDITSVWETKVAAMNSLGAQGHLVEYYTDLGRRRGVQAKRNSGPNLGLPVDAYAEAYLRIYPQVTNELV
jgi:4-oxalomesaconate hydratase